MTPDPEHPFVSRGGLKLRHALDTFHLDVNGRRCADFGCSTGGFTDCLLQAGAAQVTSIDTAYGEFAWKLRNDQRITLLERTNALHAAPPPPELRPTLIVIDLGWTPQRLCIPAALKWLAPGTYTSNPPSRIITLIKPHYELEKSEQSLLHKGVLSFESAQRITERTVSLLESLGTRVLATTRSPIAGSKASKRGNAEWLALLAPAAPCDHAA